MCVTPPPATTSPPPPITCCCYSGINQNCVENVPASDCFESGGSCTPFVGTLVPGFSYSFNQIAAGGCVSPGTGSLNFADVNLFVDRAVGGTNAVLTGNLQFTPMGFSAEVRQVRLMQVSSGFPVAVIWTGTGKPTPFAFTSVQLVPAVSEDLRVNPANYVIRIDTDPLLFPNGELQTQQLGDLTACPP